MLGALVTLAIASLVSGAAPNFAVLVVAQALVGVGIGVSYAAAVAATAEWSTAENRSRVLAVDAARAAARVDHRDAARRDPRRGQLAAGLARRAGGDGRGRDRASPPAARHSARDGTRRAPRGADVPRRRTLDDRRALRVLGWAGALVYMGALLVETYDLSIAATGLALGFGALVYVPGNFLFRRWVDAHGRLLLVALALSAAVTVGLLGAFRPSVWVSVGLFALLCFIAGGRTLAGSARGLGLAQELRLGVTGVRAAAIQAGYFVGAAVGGAALAIGGYGILGLAFAALFVGAAIPHLVPLR